MGLPAGVSGDPPRNGSRAEGTPLKIANSKKSGIDLADRLIYEEQNWTTGQWVS